MKRLIAFLLLWFLLLLPVTGMAATWNQTEPISPYKVEVLPLTVATNIFGQETYQRYPGGSIKNGDAVHLAIRVTVPSKPAPTMLAIKASGITLNCAASASLPTVPGSYYLDCTGAWTQGYAVLRGMITDAATASVTAEITGSVDLKDIALGDVTVQADSGGYLWGNGRNSMYFATYGSGQVYSAWVYGSMGGQRLTTTLLSEDSELGSVARYYLKTLGVDGFELLSGDVYMTPRLIQANFGQALDTSATFTWAATTITLPQSQPVPEVPATGMPWDAIACLFALVCLGCLLAVSTKSKTGRK